MDFSEREGHKEPKHNPLESMDDRLKTAIWNVIYAYINNDYISLGFLYPGDEGYRDVRAENLWTEFFEQDISELPDAGDYLQEIKKLYAKLKWHEVYYLIEFFLEQNKSLKPKEFNKVLTKHNAAYRVINSIVQPITDNEVIAAMESAHNNSLSKEIREHLKQAEELYSSKKDPHFDSSCLQSIKAVEGTCKFILKNDKILSKNIDELKHRKEIYNMHIINALDKIAVFRGEETAHAKTKDSYKLDKDDAILIHTICCGFVNYFKSKKQD